MCCRIWKQGAVACYTPHGDPGNPRHRTRVLHAPSSKIRTHTSTHHGIARLGPPRSGHGRGRLQRAGSGAPHCRAGCPLHQALPHLTPPHSPYRCMRVTAHSVTSYQISLQAPGRCDSQSDVTACIAAAFTAIECRRCVGPRRRPWAIGLRQVDAFTQAICHSRLYKRHTDNGRPLPNPFAAEGKEQPDQSVHC